LLLGRILRRLSPHYPVSKLQALYICGPTASGKSALAMAIARAIDGEIVNADAFQLYRGIETLSAAPDDQAKSFVPHHLYGVLDPSESCDARRYADMAQVVAGEIISRGKTPVITGGSGLYLKFLTHGASPLPSGDPALRAEFDSLSIEQLVARLQQLDPAEAARINRQNRRYVTRALEICTLSGRPASELRDAWESATREKANSLRGMVISRSRADLHHRVGTRTREMLAGRALDEVSALQTISSTCAMAIGLREIRSLLDGLIDLPACHELISAATRQYAKRQETWFRRESWLTPLIWDAGEPLPSAWQETLRKI
jgi:tRNA dimethylallyltransferase